MKSWDTQQFFKYTRMNVQVFEKLLVKIKESIAKQTRSDGISAEERLIITLQYLSQGTAMQVLAWNFHIGHTTVHQIIHDTCQAIWDHLSPQYLTTPAREEEWLQIAHKYEEKWNFPHCLGALDGKHINIQAPAGSGSLYYNYKRSFSIVLLATCDATYRFTMVDIGAYGSQSDGGIFKNSIFGQRLEKDDLNIPKETKLPHSNVLVPYFFVTDEAFPLKQFIMRPYPGKNLTVQQKVFNYRLSRARQTIENSFGILVARWRILKTTINAKAENIDHVIKAVVVLHNYCLTELGQQDTVNIYCPPGFVDTDDLDGAWREEQAPLLSVGRLGANTATRYLYNLRDNLANYLVSPMGRVPWQNCAI
nr:unnamed protein product [Callosobruchus analis]